MDGESHVNAVLRDPFDAARPCSVAIAVTEQLSEENPHGSFERIQPPPRPRSTKRDRQQDPDRQLELSANNRTLAGQRNRRRQHRQPIISSHSRLHSIVSSHEPISGTPSAAPTNDRTPRLPAHLVAALLLLIETIAGGVGWKHKWAHASI